jgi:hypothetical protein
MSESRSKLIIILWVIFSTSVFANNVPNSWAQEGASDKSNQEDKFLSHFNKYLKKIDKSLNALPFQSSKAKGHFQFKSYTTDFSISRKGLFGLSALSAASAIEVSWTKRSKDLKNTSEVSKRSFHIKSLEESFELEKVIYRMANENPAITIKKDLKQNIRDKFNEIRKLAHELEAKESANFKQDSFRLDMSFSASGNIAYFSKLGAELRIRLEWVLQKKTKLKIKRNQKFFKIIHEEVEELAKKDTKAGFKLCKITIGVGLSQKTGFLGLGKAKTGLRFFLIFKRKKRHSKSIMSKILSANEEIQVTVDTSNKSVGHKRISRRKFRKSFSNAAKRADKLVTIMKIDKKKRWNIAKFKLVYSLSLSGFLGLSNTSQHSIVEMDYKRVN